MGTKWSEEEEMSEKWRHNGVERRKGWRNEDIRGWRGGKVGGMET